MRLSLHLLPDWKELIRKAWSIRLMLVAGLLSGIEIALPFFIDTMPRGLFAGMSAAATMAALVTRILAQRNLP